MQTKINTFLPTTLKEAHARGWKALDVILITGDAYVDHPSFGVAIIGRYLESLGVRVGIIAAPDVESPETFKKLGRPEWFFGVTAGNMDSMVMRRTASKKTRSGDDYAEGGYSGIRPERATIAYCNKLRELFKKTQIVIGGLEASLRRHAHYDYWDNKVRRSLLLDAKADLLVFGMGELPLRDIVTAAKRGTPLKQIRKVRGTAVIISEDEKISMGIDAQELPSYEDLKTNKKQYALASKVIHDNQNPHNAHILLQKHANRFVCIYPPAMPLSEKEIDSIYALPFMRKPHSKYKKEIPAYKMIKFSITAMRGCFGGCAFCALTVHQGKIIQSRSVASIISEAKKIISMKGFKGYISDIGGPTANMYKLGCRDKKVESSCRKISCLYPKVCNFLKTNHSEQIKMLQKTRSISGVKKAFITSGVRMDLANLSPDYIRELAKHHVSGQLKVAPEHTDPIVLSVMKKPPVSEFEKFQTSFKKESKNADLEQYLIPYFISSHPGCGLKEQIALAEYLTKHSLRPRQVQEFIPLPMTLSADMYFSEIDPLSDQKIKTVKSEKERSLQKDLMMYYKPENAGIIRRAGRMLKK